MRILFLCSFYHSAMIFRDLMNGLKNLGHDVKVFNAVAHGTRIEEKYRSIMDEHVVNKECFSKWERFFYFRKQKKIYEALISAYDVSKYDLIHSHTLFNGGQVAWQINRNYRVPYIVSVRNTDLNVFLKVPMFGRVAEKITKCAAGVHFLSLPYKESFIKKHIGEDQQAVLRGKSIVIGNGLEDFWLKNRVARGRTCISCPIKILSVGTIDKNKNSVATLKAVGKLRASGLEIKLTVVGRVIDKKVLDYLRAHEFVSIYDHLSREELLDFYRGHDIYVMPSIHESFGRVYAEAMTQGLPVIYSKGQGFDGIFEEGYVGYPVPSRDYNYIADCILKIAKNYTAISQRCVRSSEIFDWNKISAEMDKFYRKSIRGK